MHPRVRQFVGADGLDLAARQPAHEADLMHERAFVGDRLRITENVRAGVIVAARQSQQRLQVHAVHNRGLDIGRRK
jgi:hypothetical protein